MTIRHLDTDGEKLERVLTGTHTAAQQWMTTSAGVRARDVGRVCGYCPLCANGGIPEHADHLLPHALLNNNPLAIPRTVNGHSVN